MADLEIESTATGLRMALARAFAPKIDDADAMRFAAGLSAGKTDGELGLENVPIDVVYRAMLLFKDRRS